MDCAHIFDLAPELLVKILEEIDEQSLGRMKSVCQYMNSLIHRHRNTLARQMIYMAVFKEGELTVERYLRRSRWEDYKYTLPSLYIDEQTIRQLACADIDTIRFQMDVPDVVALKWAGHFIDLMSTTFRVVFARCHISVNAIIMLLTALQPQQIAMEFGTDWNGVSVQKLCEYSYFRERLVLLRIAPKQRLLLNGQVNRWPPIQYFAVLAPSVEALITGKAINHLNLINSYITDSDLRLLHAQYLTVYETSQLTVAGLRQILLDWYDGKRSIKDYHLSISGQIVPERLFDGLPTRRRSIIAWEVRNSETFLHVSIIGPGVSIVKIFDVITTS